MKVKIEINLTKEYGGSIIVSLQDGRLNVYVWNLRSQTKLTTNLLIVY